MLPNTLLVCVETSSQKGNDRSLTASHQNILNSSQVKDFLNWSRAANSAVHGWIRQNFKLIRDYIVILCKNEEDPIKNEGARVLTSLLFDFSDAQEQQLQSQWWNPAEIRTHSSFYCCPSYLQE